MAQSTSLEVKGLRFEAAGLSLILAAALWQASVSDWLDRYPIESIAYAQEEVNVAVLTSIDQLSLRMSSDTPETRRYYGDQVSKVVGQGLTNAIEIRKQREMLTRTQGKWLGHVRVWLAALGALSVILGKVLVSLHKQRGAIA